MIVKTDEDGILLEPCLECDEAYVEDIWNEWCCDKKECVFAEWYERDEA